MVPQPLGALDAGQRGARRGAQAGGAPRRDGDGQHERHRARRAHVRHRRGRRPAGRADRRAGDDLPQRPRRHAAERLHRPPQGRPGHRRRCTPSPTTGRCRTCSTSWSVPTAWSARSSRSRSTAGRWSTTARSPSAGWSSTTCRSRSTSTRRCAASASRTPGSEDRPARVGLVPLGGRGSDVRWFDVAPCYVFHPLNAYDDGERVVLDVVRYGRMFAASRLGPDESTPQLWRWTLDLTTGPRRRAPAERRAAGVPAGRRARRRPAPRRRLGDRACAPVDGRNDFGGQLVRIDGATGDARRIDLGPGRLSGEWVMVPARRRRRRGRRLAAQPRPRPAPTDRTRPRRAGRRRPGRRPGGHGAAADAGAARLPRQLGADARDSSCPSRPARSGRDVKDRTAGCERRRRIAYSPRMPRLRQVPRAEVTSPVVMSMYKRLFGDRDPVAEPGTATGTPGNWWTVFANSPDVLEHAGRGFGLYANPDRKVARRAARARARPAPAGSSAASSCSPSTARRAAATASRRRRSRPSRRGRSPTSSSRSSGPCSPTPTPSCSGSGASTTPCSTP